MDGIHPVVLRLLRSRGITDPQEISAFLHPSWDAGVHDPFLFSQMPKAVTRIFAALEKGEKITVHGDYDADGVTGSAVLITTLREIEGKLGAEKSHIDFYIPHRDEEGYGLHPETVEALNKQGTNVIITVDCGIACVEEIEQAKAEGIDTIVVDHHQFGEKLPDAILIHPKLPGESYPFPHLAAVGVAWKLACALVAEARTRGLDIPDGWEKWLLDLVSIATVTDMVPMVGENRILELYGLKVLNKTRRPGLKALITLAGPKGELDSEFIGFGLGPRINAAGRMDHASLALRCLLAGTDEEANALAGEMERFNRDRQKASAKMLEEAEKKDETGDKSIVVVWSEDWSPSLVGLVAGKLMDRTGKPCVAIGKFGDRWVGSGRSFAAYDITAAMRRAGEGILSHVGGHVQACGFSFPFDAPMSELIERLYTDAARELKDVELTPTLAVDAEVTLDLVSVGLADALSVLQPFGEGNRRPVFVSRNLEVVSADTVGQTQKHVRCVLKSPSGFHLSKFIGFNKLKVAGALDELPLQVGQRVSRVVIRRSLGWLIVAGLRTYLLNAPAN